MFRKYSNSLDDKLQIVRSQREELDPATILEYQFDKFEFRHMDYESELLLDLSALQQDLDELESDWRFVRSYLDLEKVNINQYFETALQTARSSLQYDLQVTKKHIICDIDLKTNNLNQQLIEAKNYALIRSQQAQQSQIDSLHQLTVKLQSAESTRTNWVDKMNYLLQEVNKELSHQIITEINEFQAEKSHFENAFFNSTKFIDEEIQNEKEELQKTIIQIANAVK
ncbi:Hypothetical_protein [Hexamita inflata]|uniref:Hypothetical_protein n=1 Tax=Hexamita inflata TaxID=28002 RepID=A0ABP1LMG8_9EUKA